jgi:hypothetical protein
MVAGVVVLLVLTIRIGQESPWTLGYKDVMYWVVVGALIALRYIDVTRFKGRTLAGEPATLRNVVRYATGLLGTSAVAWTLAQSVEISA